MSKINFDSDTLFSAVKRKDVRDMLVYLLGEAGETEAMEIMKSKSRITDAAIREVREALGTTKVEYKMEATATVETDDKVETEEEEADPTDLTFENGGEVNENVIDLAGMLKDLEKAIEKGKKKKAKKILAELEDLGLKGSEIKKLKKQVKEL